MVVGDVYVADTGNDRIQKFYFSSNCLLGTLITDGICFARMWGSFGSGNGNFSSPSPIAVDSSSGNVYVSDKGNSRIQVFVSR